MTDSIPIPLSLLTETRSALDAALAVAPQSAEAYGQVARVRAKLDAEIVKIRVSESASRDNIRLKRKALSAIALLHEVANGLEG